jgi:flavorubredoxin
LNLRDIRYVVLNHLEPDHTGWLKNFMKLHEDFEILASPKGLELFRAFFGIEKNLVPVRSGDRINLGGGKELVFIEVPHVHWPETIFTFETSTGTLFSCDIFSSFGSAGTSPYDDHLGDDVLGLFEAETLRYYANVLATFSSSVKRSIEKVRVLDVKTIAPAHGVIWRRDPKRIIELYRKYTGYMMGAAEAEITIIWGSMYGMTEKAVGSLIDGITSENVPVHVFQWPKQWKSSDEKGSSGERPSASGPTDGPVVPKRSSLT